MLRILHDTNYDFIKHWRKAVFGTIGFIVLGMALLGVHAARYNSALNYSVEFLGGAVVQLKFAKDAPADAVRSATDDAGFKGSEVTTFGNNANYMIKVPPAEGSVAAP